MNNQSTLRDRESQENQCKLDKCEGNASQFSASDTSDPEDLVFQGGIQRVLLRD